MCIRTNKQLIITYFTIFTTPRFYSVTLSLIILCFHLNSSPHDSRRIWLQLFHRMLPVADFVAFLISIHISNNTQISFIRTRFSPPPKIPHRNPEILHIHLIFFIFLHLLFIFLIFGVCDYHRTELRRAAKKSPPGRPPDQQIPLLFRGCRPSTLW